MFERYDEASRRALFFARYEVAQLGGLTIEPEHLVLGILRGSAQDILRFAGPGTTADTIRNALQLPASQPKVSTSVEIPFSQGTKDALLRAPIEADDLSNVFIHPEHIVLGILVKTSGEAARALSGAGVTVDAVRRFQERARRGAGDSDALISRHWKASSKPRQEEAYCATSTARRSPRSIARRVRARVDPPAANRTGHRIQSYGVALGRGDQGVRGADVRPPSSHPPRRPVMVTIGGSSITRS